MNNTYKTRVMKYALITAFGGFVFGLDAANISGAVRYVSAQFGLDSMQMGSVVGITGIGAIVALFFTGALCNRFGRKNVLLTIASLYTLSSTVSAFANSYHMLLVGRFIGGLAFSSLSIASMYIGEIAPADQRGKFVSINQLLITIGSLLAFVINYFLVKALGHYSWLTDATVWRYMLGAEIIPNIIWILMLLSVPKSPRWLVTKGRMEEARETFKTIVPEDQIESLILSIRQKLGTEDSSAFEQFKILFSPKMRLMLTVAIIYAIAQQVIGINAVLFYAPTVFEQIGMSVQSTFMQTIYLGIVCVIFTVVAMVYIERLGRRFLTRLGLCLIVIAHLSSWYGFHSATYQITEQTIQTLQDQKIVTHDLQTLKGKVFKTDVAFKASFKNFYSPQKLPLVTGSIIHSSIHINAAFILFGIFGFLIAFYISVGPIMWVIFSEIFPNAVRSVAIPFSALIVSVTSTLVQQFFPWQLEHFGAGNTFLSYGVSAFITLVLLWKFLPETKGKSIEQIEEELTIK